MEIRIREASDGDWIEVDVDGKEFYSGHSLPEHEVVKLLKRAGATVIEEDGDFCSECGNWYTTASCPCEEFLGSFEMDEGGDGIEDEED